MFHAQISSFSNFITFIFKFNPYGKQQRFKNVFAQKFNEFQLNGLQSYGKYLKQQQKLAKTHDNWESYGKYIENEIKRNDKKIAALNEKMA